MAFLVCSIAIYFTCLAVFWRVKLQMTSRNLQRYYTRKCLTRDLLSNVFFSRNAKFFYRFGSFARSEGINDDYMEPGVEPVSCSARAEGSARAEVSTGVSPHVQKALRTSLHTSRRLCTCRRLYRRLSTCAEGSARAEGSTDVSTHEQKALRTSLHTCRVFTDCPHGHITCFVQILATKTLVERKKFEIFVHLTFIGLVNYSLGGT